MVNHCTVDGAYRERELKNVQVKVLLSLAQANWQGTANASDDRQKSESRGLHVVRW
jgi:hypothetical protein